jgi:hypothetical protein
MRAGAKTNLLAAVGNFKWIFLVVCVGATLLSFRSFFVLQLLTADLIFTVFLVLAAVTIALLVVLLAAIGCVSEWSLAAWRGSHVRAGRRSSGLQI